MKQIAAIVGDYYHSHDVIKQSLLKALDPQLAANQVQVDFRSVAELSDLLKDPPDVVVLYAWGWLDGRQEQKWLTESLSEQIVTYVNNGGSWLAWHTGMSSYDEESSYIKMLRGHFITHPRPKQITYTGTGTSPIIAKDATFTIVDEHYFVHCDEAHTEVFLRSSSEDGQSIAGWHHRFGKGLVCCLTPAHDDRGLSDPSFINLLQQTLLFVTQS